MNAVFALWNGEIVSAATVETNCDDDLALDSVDTRGLLTAISPCQHGPGVDSGKGSEESFATSTF